MQTKSSFLRAPKGKKRSLSLRSIIVLIFLSASMFYTLGVIAIQKNNEDGKVFSSQDLFQNFMSGSTSGSDMSKNEIKSSSANKRANENDAPKSKYRNISCPEVIERSKNDENFYDPNKALDESPKRHTITNPPFWISLHLKWFDPMRWVSIMDKGNYYETGLTEVFKGILNHTSTPGLVLDIGMNIGWFTLWSRKFGHRVATFEPNPVMHVRVCESLALNGWDMDDSVRIYPYGVADEEGTMNLTTGKNPGGSSFREDRLAKKFRKSIPVNVVKLDNVARQEGWLLDDQPPIHLMKIDVEGYENFVVKGGTALIRSGRASNIIVENSLMDEALVVEMLNTFYQSGYHVHALLSVNGDVLKNTMPGDLNTEIGMIQSRDSGFAYDEHNSPWIHYLYTRTLNMWWVKRDNADDKGLPTNIQ